MSFNYEKEVQKIDLDAVDTIDLHYRNGHLFPSSEYGNQRYGEMAHYWCRLPDCSPALVGAPQERADGRQARRGNEQQNEQQ